MTIQLRQIYRKIIHKLNDFYLKLINLSLKTKILLFISSFAVTIPSILLYLSISAYYYVGVERVFGDQISDSIQQTVEIAKMHLNEQMNNTKADLSILIENIHMNLNLLTEGKEILDKFLNTKAQILGLSEIVLFSFSNSEIKVIGQSKSTHVLSLEIPYKALEKVNSSNTYIEQYYEDDADDIKIITLGKFDFIPFTYILITKEVDKEVAKYITASKSSVNKYLELKNEKDIVRYKVILIFIICSILFFCLTLYIAHKLGILLVKPIDDLVKATSVIEVGNFDVLVPENNALDEIRTLSKGFNQMLLRIKNQHNSLIEARDRLDERMKFIETVLSELSSGVIVLNNDSTIELINASSLKILQIKDKNCSDALKLGYSEIFPELKEIIEEILMQSGNLNNLKEIYSKPNKLSNGIQIEIIRNYKIIYLLVRIDILFSSDNSIENLIIKFDDVTELRNIHHLTAWTNIARKVAHEIKNPLTPIQLSIERLKTKFSKQITQDVNSFNMYADTIIARVTEIQKMISDFLLFSQIAQPNIQKNSLLDILREVILLYQNSYEQRINYKLIYNHESDDNKIYIYCDRGQIAQVFINLLKNASEAVNSKIESQKNPEYTFGEIVVEVNTKVNTNYNGTSYDKTTKEQYISVKIIDDGCGIDEKIIDLITEPYVTTKTSGTGLGLSITKKIIEEHNGKIIIKNREKEEGTEVELLLKKTFDLKEQSYNKRKEKNY